MATSELIHVGDEGMGAISLYRTPEQAIGEARQCAVALKQVMAEKPNPVYFPDGKGGKEQYLEAEDWQLVAAFYGTTPKIMATDYVDFGPGGKGFKATAALVDRNGLEVSRAEAMCLDTEENWGMVTEYQWQDRLDANNQKIWNPRGGREGKGGYEREKVAIGEKPKPLFQLMSMAQTRATSKVIATKFRYVAVLGGFGGAPAEEMTGRREGTDFDYGANQPGERKPPQRESAPPARQEAVGTIHGAPGPSVPPQAQNAQEPTPAPPQQGNGEVIITERQGKMLFAIQRSVGINDEECKRRLATIGYTGHRDHLPKRMFNAALDAVDPDFRFHQKQ